MPDEEQSAIAPPAPSGSLDLVLASASVGFGTLSLAALAVVAWLTIDRTPTVWWIGPVVSLGGLAAWTTGVALGGVALGSSAGRRALAGLGVCAFAACCFALMVLVLDFAS